MEKVSIIIPCYNVESYIEKCLNSIIHQTYRNIEVICIDDGSQDNTLEILKRYQQHEDRIKVIGQQNKGISASRNAGLEIASGTYIMFMDSDDWLEPKTIDKVLELGFDLICFSYNRIFKNRVEPRKLNLSGIYDSEEIQRRIVGLIGDELSDPTQANSLVTVWGKIYNFSIINDNKIRFTDTKEIGSGEDALFNLAYLNYCKDKTLVKDIPLYNYRRDNLASFTSLYKPKLITQWENLHQKIYNTLTGKNEVFHEAFYNRIALSIIGLGLNEMERKGKTLHKAGVISKIINNPLYVKSYHKLDYQYLPLHWKLLFLMAKYRLTWGVFIMLKMIHLLWKRKNN